MNNKENPFYFRGKGYELFGILHQPLRAPSGIGYVFCHPFAEEKLWAHRVYVSFARTLAERGHAVLRFDAMGHGDSDGEFEDATLETRLSDTESALEALGSKVPSLREIGLLGLRFGATVAALVADRRDDVKRLVLWEPVLEGSAYLQDVLRSHLTAQMVLHGRILVNRRELTQRLAAGGQISVEGYTITGRLFDQVSKVRLRAPRTFAGECLVVQLDKGVQPGLRPELYDLCQHYPRAQLRTAAEEPFWRDVKPYYNRARNLFAETLDWMEGSHG